MKLNKKTLKDLIYEILLEQEQAAPSKAKSTGSRRNVPVAQLDRCEKSEYARIAQGA